MARSPAVARAPMAAEVQSGKKRAFKETEAPKKDRNVEPRLVLAPGLAGCMVCCLIKFRSCDAVRHFSSCGHGPCSFFPD